MQRVGSGHPDAVHARIARAERAQVGNIAVDEARAYLLDRQLDVILEQIDPHEAEAGIAHFAHAEPRKLDRIVAHRMIVRRAVLGRNVAHRLADRLAQPHAHLDRLGRGADAGNELQAAVNLAAEVEQNRRPLALFGRKDGLGRSGRRSLAVALQQQVLRAVDQLAVLHPHHADRRQIGPRSGIELRLVGHVFRENGGQAALAHRTGGRQRTSNKRRLKVFSFRFGLSLGLSVIVHAGGSCRAAFSELRRYYRPEIEKRPPSRSYKLSDHLSILQAGSGKTARKIALPVPAPSSPCFTSGQAGAPKRQQPNMEAGSGLQTAETSGSPRVGRNDRRP